MYYSLFMNSHSNGILRPKRNILPYILFLLGGRTDKTPGRVTHMHLLQELETRHGLMPRLCLEQFKGHNIP